MFEATLTAAPVSHRLWGTCAGVTGQALVVGALILAPLIFPQVLPQVESLVTLVAPGPPPPPPAAGMLVRPRTSVAATRTFRCDFCAPVAVPSRVVTVVDEPPQATGIGVPGGVPGGQAGGVPNGVLGSILSAIPAIAPPHPAEAAPANAAAAAPIPRLRIGGLVKPAVPIFRVEPQYPSLARQARVSGVVELEGVIGVDGRIHELTVKSGHPLLVKAAVDAVSRWIYRPTMLNGQPIEVVTPITVTFRLN
jgi:periplasmic protein TonB